ncbi:hypothetical protein C8Q74DRAFT_1317942 [Fomes fomentarius]|nr:hypothetical protein C8Q74DRAFT_1317942 [Fomes fomentarius]
MAESFRPNKLSSYLVPVLLCLFVLLVLANDAVASPIHTTNLAGAHTDYVQSTHWRRVAPIVKTSEIGNVTAVINPSTNQVIAQGSGTDGGGTDFSLTAIIWLAFVLVTGLPLALAGIRLHRMTTGLAVGLGLTLCVWAAFVNTVNSDGIPDIALTVIPLGGFAIGAALGALNFGRWAGILLIGILGGFSVGVRVVLLRPGLLVSNYVVNWLVMVPFAILGLAAVLVKQRFGLVTCCAAMGTFLVGLGVDLVLEKQSGMSFALRFLFDRNNSHFLDIVHRGYNPTLMTQIVLGASMGAIPFLAIAQHKVFKGPFRRKAPEIEEREGADDASFIQAEPGLNGNMSELKPSLTRMQLMKSRFSVT